MSTCACGSAAREGACRDLLRVIEGDRFGIGHDIPGEFVERVRAIRDELKRLRVGSREADGSIEGGAGLRDLSGDRASEDRRTDHTPSDLDSQPAPPPERVVTECYDCGLAYGGDGWIECVVAHDVWEKISPSGNGAGILCITCISRRLKRLGLDKVPVILCGTEAIRVAGQEEAFNRGWDAAKGRIQELELELALGVVHETLTP